MTRKAKLELQNLPRVQNNAVRLPNGRYLTRADLPPPQTMRWVASRKAKVVIAVESGLICFEEAQKFYELSREEYELWRENVRSNGMDGLKTTHIQKFRQL